MKPQANPAGRGRDLAVMTLEIAGATGPSETRSTVLCPCEQRTKPLEACLPCIDSKGLDLDPNARPGFVDCLGEAPLEQPELRGPGEAERSLADRTPVTAVMSRNVVALRADVPLDRARALFLERGIGGAPVVDGEGRPLGVLSKTDLLRGLAPGATVADAMSRNVLTVPESAPVSETAALLAFEGIHRAPVLSREGRVVGMVTILDILRWLSRQDGYLLPAAHSLQAR
jgi:CBS domain-containing protein